MKLSIPEPCHENWNKMTPSEKGRFCWSCQKEVVDFTSMTKVEIKEFFIQKASESTCGRFENQQMESFNRPEIKPKRINSKPWWIAAATVFLFANKGFSQGETIIRYHKGNQVQTDSTKSGTKKVSQLPNPNKTNNVKASLLSDSIKSDSVFSVSGTILDENGDSLGFASVFLDGTSIGAVTDSNGKFEFKVPKSHEGTLKIKVSFIGYAPIDTTFINFHKDTDVGKIRFTEKHGLVLGGAIMTVGKIYYKPSFWQRTKFFFRRLFH